MHVCYVALCTRQYADNICGECEGAGCSEGGMEGDGPISHSNDLFNQTIQRPVQICLFAH